MIVVIVQLIVKALAIIVVKMYHIIVFVAVQKQKVVVIQF